MPNDEKKSPSPEKPSPKRRGSGKKRGFRPARWLREVRSELKKVVWPTKSQISNNTFVVLVVMAAAAVVLWAFDTVAARGVEVLVALAGT